MDELRSYHVMSRFPSANHLAAWAEVAPGNHESAGKRRSGRTRKGNPALGAALNQAAHAAAHTKTTYLAAQYHRLAGRRGAKKAIRFGMKQPKWIIRMEAIYRDSSGYWVERGWDKEAIPLTTSVIDAVAADRYDPRQELYRCVVLFMQGRAGSAK